MNDETLTAEAPIPEITPEASLPAPAPWRRRGRRKEVPIRHLLDGRLFRLLCAPGGESALEGFRASLARHGLASGKDLPPLELTPLMFLEAIGIEPPQLSVFPLPASVLKREEYVKAATATRLFAEEQFAELPEIKPDLLRKRVEDLRSKAPEEAHDLFDLCVTGFVSRDGFEKEIYQALSYEFLFRFPFPEVLREEVSSFLMSSLFDVRLRIPGSCKARIIKSLWDKLYEHVLRANAGVRREIQALDRELRLRTRRDHLAWEAVPYAILGQPGPEGSHPVTAFVLASADRTSTRCVAFKTTLRAVLDQLKNFDSLRSSIDDWKPGTLVPCKEDGTVETVMATGDLPVYLAWRKAG